MKKKRQITPTIETHGIEKPGRVKIYTDPVRHAQHWAWLRKKAQALYRGEEWNLSIQDWFRMWDESDQWDNRGRHPHASAMFMIDPEKGWHVWNVEIVDRTERLAYLASNQVRPVHKRGGRPKKNGN